MSRKLNVFMPSVDLRVSTPFLWHSSEGLTLPHLTVETLEASRILTVAKDSFPDFESGEKCETVDKPPLPILVSLGSLINRRKTLRKYAKGLASFVGLPKSPILLTTADPVTLSRSGYNGSKTVSVWSNGNRYKVSSGDFIDAVQSAKPAVIVALSDGDTPKDASNKRILKSVQATLDHLDAVLEAKRSGALGDGVLVYGAVEGGFNEEQRIRSAVATAEREVDGFLMEGFHANGAESGEVDLANSDVLPLVRKVVERLPESKPRMYMGSCDPLQVVSLVECGIDMFDASYALHLTKRNAAIDADVLFNVDLENFEIESEEDILRQERGHSSTSFELEMSDPRYKEDFNPISSNCNCYTCLNHTRAYVNHLIATKELLAPVMLTMHNTFSYSRSKFQLA